MKKIINGVAVDMTADEIDEFNAQQAEWAAGANDRLAQEIRKKRDLRLAETDWRAGVDLILSEEWAAYRQALRDLPAQTGFPNTITWPTKPSE